MLIKLTDFRHIIYTLFFGAVLISCESDQEPDKNIEYYSGDVKDAILECETIFETFRFVQCYGFGGIGSQNSKSFSLAEPIQIWNDNTLTLDFNDVSNYNGKIIVQFTKQPVYEDGLSADITFENYINGAISINGTSLLSIQYVSDNEFVEFKHKSSMNLIVSNNGKACTWDMENSINWFEGMATSNDISDDKFIFNGYIDQYDDDKHIKHNGLNGIYYNNNCKYVNWGNMLYFDPVEKLTIYCDFGANENNEWDEACDSYVLLDMTNTDYSLLYDYTN